MLIAIEGLDGSGLSTQSNLLRDFLIKKGYQVILTKEQTDNAIGGLIKSILKKEFDVSPLGLQLLFAADRAHHLASEIDPALMQDKIVISDRYILSSLAFGSPGVDLEFLKQINSKFRKPDITFIIDTKPETCLERIKKTRFHLELHEEKEKLEQTRKNYLSLKDYFPNVFVIDGNGTIEEVEKNIQKIVLEKISNNLNI